MYILANFLGALAQVLDMALTIYVYIIIARALISWVNPDPYNPIVRFLYQATEPVLYRIRGFMPFMGGLDLSPIVAILAVYFLKYFLVSTLIETAMAIKGAGGI